MIDVIKQRIEGSGSNENKVNKTREFLQILALKILYDRKYFTNIAFVGGTALRILFNLKRYSEDLDFSVVDKKGYSFVSIIESLKNDIAKYGLNVEARPNDKNTVNSSMIKFPGLLNDLGLSGFKEQKLSIKFEIDTNPPMGWGLALTPVSDPYVFAIKHMDLPSLFATKLHACLFRKYSKGRDYYDLIWYFSKKAKLNYPLLNNAIQQTVPGQEEVNPGNIKTLIKDRIAKIDFKSLRNDVERFLEDKNELKMIEKDILLNIVDSYDSF